MKAAGLALVAMSRRRDVPMPPGTGRPPDHDGARGGGQASGCPIAWRIRSAAPSGSTSWPAPPPGCGWRRSRPWSRGGRRRRRRGQGGRGLSQSAGPGVAGGAGRRRPNFEGDYHRRKSWPGPGPLPLAGSYKYHICSIDSDCDGRADCAGGLRRSRRPRRGAVTSRPGRGSSGKSARSWRSGIRRRGHRAYGRGGPQRRRPPELATRREASLGRGADRGVEPRPILVTVGPSSSSHAAPMIAHLDVRFVSPTPDLVALDKPGDL
jgi:hypothetical protein